MLEMLVWWVGIRALDAYVRLAVRLSVTGLDNLPTRGPAIVVANHVSYLDPVVLLVLAHRRGRQLRALAVREAFARPVVGWFMRIGRQIPVGAGLDRMVALRGAKEALARGDLVLVYPEGTITGARPVAAKGGAGLLALTLGVPVIPIFTRGLERAGRRRWRRRAQAVIGRPVDLTAVHGARGRPRYEAASERMLAAIRKLSAAAVR